MPPEPVLQSARPIPSLTRTREVLLPKFKLEKDYNLVEALRSAGVTALFDRNSNMTGISDQRVTIDLVRPALCTHPCPLPCPGSAPSRAPRPGRACSLGVRPSW